MSCCPNLTIAENAAKMSGKIAIKINFGGDMLISSGDPKRPAAHVITSSLMLRVTAYRLRGVFIGVHGCAGREIERSGKSANS